MNANENSAMPSAEMGAPDDAGDHRWRQLGDLYGSSAATIMAAKLRAMLDRVRLRFNAEKLGERKNLALTQQDVLLIAYADHVRCAGERPLATMAEFCRTHLKGIVSGVHLLPFYPWSSDDGFSVKDFLLVDPAYGSWEDIAQLGKDFDLMFDAVFNHVSAQGEWFQKFLLNDPRYREFFIAVEGDPDLSLVVRPRALPLLTEFATTVGLKRVWTTFSADQVDLNFKNPEVLLAVVEALLFYAARGARFIRLDTIAFLWKEIGTTCLHLPQTHRVIQLLRAILDEAAPNVMLITETNVPHIDNISYFGDGGNEAQLVYNFALPPLMLHSMQTGNAGKLTRWAQSLTLPSENVTFFNFLASHDGIGLNPARGILSEAEIDALVQRALDHGGFISRKAMPDGSQLPYELNINYLDALSNPAENEPPELAARKFLTAHAILLSLQGMPGIYFHSMFGSRGDRTGSETSGIPRRINRQKLDRFVLEEEIQTAHSLRNCVWNGLKNLLRIRRSRPVFHPQAVQRVLSADSRLFTLWRIPLAGDVRMLCLHNVSPQTVDIGGLLDGLPASSSWTDAITGRRYRAGAAGSAELAGFHTLWLESGSKS